MLYANIPNLFIQNCASKAQKKTSQQQQQQLQQQRWKQKQKLESNLWRS